MTYYMMVFITFKYNLQMNQRIQQIFYIALIITILITSIVINPYFIEHT